MSTSTTLPATSSGDGHWDDALRAAGAFLAGFRSADTRKGYRRDLSCWLEFCAAHQLHPYVGVRRTHVEVYLRQLEQQMPALANSTLRRRISTLSSWFTWLEDEEINVGNPAARVNRPRRHSRPQPLPTCSQQPRTKAATATADLPTRTQRPTDIGSVWP